MKHLGNNNNISPNVGERENLPPSSASHRLTLRNRYTEKRCCLSVCVKVCFELDSTFYLYLGSHKQAFRNCCCCCYNSDPIKPTACAVILENPPCQPFKVSQISAPFFPPRQSKESAEGAQKRYHRQFHTE